MRADRVRRVKGYREAWPEKEGGTGRKEVRKEERRRRRREVLPVSEVAEGV